MDNVQRPRGWKEFGKLEPLNNRSEADEAGKKLEED